MASRPHTSMQEAVPYADQLARLWDANLLFVVELFVVSHKLLPSKGVRYNFNCLYSAKVLRYV